METMYVEIIEALENYYKDNEDVLIDCLRYLQDSGDKGMTRYLGKWFDAHDRCDICGRRLDTYQEPHRELDGCPMENMTEFYCPNCDGEKLRRDDFDD